MLSRIAGIWLPGCPVLASKEDQVLCNFRALIKGSHFDAYMPAQIPFKRLWEGAVAVVCGQFVSYGRPNVS